MSLFEWRSEFELGVASVDHEHRELVATINRLHDALYRPASEDSVLEFLGELNRQVGAHFALEEAHMRGRGYPRLGEHKADHERLLDEVRDLMDDYEDGAVVDLDTFAERLQRWFSVHFSTHDALLHGSLV